MNPFSDEYCRSEIKKFNCPAIDSKGIKIKKVKIEGRCDDFLNVKFRAGVTAIEDCPVFFIEGMLWMSLTPMEIQSHYLPIQRGREKERVATVGLGIGYFTVRVMSSPKVKVLDVYEIDPKVVEVFKKNFSEREGFEKVNFIVGDFKKTLKNKEYDFCYIDCYQTGLPDELLKDYRAVHKKNKIGLIRSWGIEKCYIFHRYQAPEDIQDFLAMNPSELKFNYGDAVFDRKARAMIQKYELGE